MSSDVIDLIENDVTITISFFVLIKKKTSNFHVSTVIDQEIEKVLIECETNYRHANEIRFLEII